MIEDHGEPDDSEGSKENLSREWVYGVAYLISPVFIPIFTGGAVGGSVGDWIMLFVFGWLLIIPITFFYCVLVVLFFRLAIDFVESKLNCEWSDKTKLVLAVIIGVPIGIWTLSIGGDAWAGYGDTQP